MATQLADGLWTWRREHPEWSTDADYEPDVASYAVRDDAVEPSLGTDKALEQAPEQDAGHFLVPRVIGG